MKPYSRALLAWVFLLMLAPTFQAQAPLPPFADLDGDLKADLTYWRPSDGGWYTLQSSTGYATSSTRLWGSTAASDRPVPGDYDGDGKLDPAVWRASTGHWLILQSSTGYTGSLDVTWGDVAQGDHPVPADYDGDRKTDPAIWRETDGYWHILTSSSNYQQVISRQWGSLAQGDSPMPADFDGDGKADPAIWRRPTGFWYATTSSSNYATTISAQWGNDAVFDQPVPGDYDGDGKADPAVWRPDPGDWLILESSTSFQTWKQYAWGAAAQGDRPVPLDYDGDGKVDLGIWREPDGGWYWKTSSSNFTAWQGQLWGSAAQHDEPVSLTPLLLGGGPAGCLYTVTPESETIGADGGTLTFSVDTTSACDWTAVEQSDFLSITAGTSGIDDGTVTVTANVSSTTRSAVIIIAGTTVSIVQNGVPCTYNVSPTTVSVGSDAVTVAVDVTAPAGCTWTASEQSEFFSISAGSSGIGSGSTSFSVSANSGESTRTGNATVAGVSVTITQDGIVTYDVQVSGPNEPPVLDGSEIVADSGGDLRHPLTCRGTAWTNYSWAPVKLELSILIDRQQVAATDFLGTGSVTGHITYFAAASVSNRTAECRAKNGPKVDTDSYLLEGSGPPSIRLTTGSFIPDNWVPYPHPEDPWSIIFGGDDRDFREDAATARASQVVDLMNSAVSNSRYLSGPYNYTGLTREFDRETSLTDPHNGVLTAEAVNDWIWGWPMKTAWELPSQEQMTWEHFRLGPSENLYSTIRFRSIVSARDPLVAFSPYLDYKITVTLTFGRNQVQYLIQGCHDEFPAYEAYLGGQAIYTRLPTAGLLAMLGDCDIAIESTAGVIR